MERKEAIARHIATHTERSQEDISAVNTVESFLDYEGKFFPNFSVNDKWPNHDGTFEYVSNPKISRIPLQTFYVQIKGTKNYTIDKEGCIHYQLKSLGFPAFIANEVTSDPGILFVVLNPNERRTGGTRLFWKYMSPSFLAEVDFTKDSKIITFSSEDEILYSEESMEAFCWKLEKIVKDFSFIKKLDKGNYSVDDLMKIIAARNDSVEFLIEILTKNPLMRDQISQQILPSLTDLCFSVMMLNSYDLGYPFADEKIAWDLSRLNKDTKYLSVFLQGLKYIGCRIPEEGQSERLMLKYKDYLWNIKLYLEGKFKPRFFLKNLAQFPSFMPQIDEDYYKSISIGIEREFKNPLGIRNLRYNVHSVTPFFVDDRRYYEITLQYAEKYATKFHRITVYSKYPIISDYSVKIAYHETEIPVFGIITKIKILDKYKISIYPRCLNLMGNMINNPISVSGNHKEYENLMDFLTTSGLNLLDFIDLSDGLFNYYYDNIYGNAKTTMFGDVLNKLKKCFSSDSKRIGKNNIRYSLLVMKENILEDVYQKDGAPYFNDLSINPKCRPFEENPFVSNLVGHITTKNVPDLAKVVSNKDCYEISSPYIGIRSLINETGEIFFYKKRISDYAKINDYNNNLNDWQIDNGYSIIEKDGVVYIDSYKKTTISILKRLKQWSLQPCVNQEEKNDFFLKNCKLDLNDDLKRIALENIFVKSHILLIYGAAGTGKTRLIEYIYELMKESSILFLTNTHTAKQNLMRRIDSNAVTFRTIDKYINENLPVMFDLIIIDECSTIDNRKMEKLLKKIPDGTKLVFSGDIYQIESIEFGNWFHYAKDIINTNGAKVELLSNFRTNNELLIDLWNSVRNKEPLVTEKLVIDGAYSRDLGESIFKSEASDEIVLCLNYDGKFGLNNLNRYFQDANKNMAVSWEDWTFKKDDRILFLDTNRFTRLYNNLKGKIVDIEKKSTYILFTIDVNTKLTRLQCLIDGIEYVSDVPDGTRIKIDVILSNDDLSNEERVKTVIPFQLGYAVTIHKAQGLEYESVKIVIPASNEEEIDHSIFYTAITRAKEKLKIYWSSETMNTIVANFTRENVEKISLDIIKESL